MNVRKRRLALLMCICMIFTLLPFSALADATTQDDGIVYGKYDDTGWHEDKTLTAESSVKHYPASGETSDNKANIDYSKTAVKNDDGSYSVTLTIKSKTSETAPGASAVVLVIDNSNSMTDDRLNSAKAAAKAFVDSYGKSGSGRYIALVSFADYAKKYDFSEGWWPWRDKVYWLDASNADNRRAITASIDKMGRNGGTNFEQGLSAANDLLKDGAVYKKISKDNKFAIALTDGQPTYYGNGWPTPSGTGKSCNEATYNKTIEAAKTLKSNAASLYTVCYGAASDVIDWNNETVGDFLANRIASPGEAYNATDSENSLSEAFAKIYESIKHGISSGFTVTDPMGEYVTLQDKSLTDSTISNGKIIWEPKNGTTVENTDSSKTTTYTLTYRVTLGEVPEDGTYPLNKDTTLKFKDGETDKTLQFNVPGVYREAPKYTVTYKYIGDVPVGAQLPSDNTQYKKGDLVTVAGNPSVDGWTFSGWSVANDSPTKPTITNDQFNMPNGNVVLEGSWTKLEGYTVKYMWGDTVLDTKAGAALAVGMNTPNESPKSIEGYTPKSNNSISITISTDPNKNVIIFEYYKNVTLTANSKTVTYNGEEQIVSGFTGAPEGADFSAIEVGAKGIQPNTYPANFAEGTKGTVDATGKYIVTDVVNGNLVIEAAYQVQYEYKNAPADAPACPTDDTYYADNTTVTLQQPGTAPTGYKFVGWKVDGTGDVVTEVTINGANVRLVGEWEPVTGLSYVVHYYWVGTEDKVAPDKIVDKQTFGTVITSETPIEVTNYKAVPEQVSNLTISTENENNVITFYYYKNIELTANNGEAKYDGTLKTVDGFKAIVAADNGADIYEQLKEVLAAHGQGTDADRYDVCFTRGGEIIPATDLVGSVLNDKYWVTKADQGKLTITPRSLIITSASDSKYYDGTPLTNKTITVTGDGFVEGEGATYNVTGSQTEVGSSKNTFNVIFNDNTKAANYAVEKKLGDLTVNRRPMPPVNPPIMDEIIVEITGNSDSVVYDGTEHSVKGYTVKISDPRYTEADFTFTGKAEASGVNAGTYEMGLKAEQFKNTNARFTNVKFVIKADGVLTITPKELTITAGSKTEYGPTPVTCDEWTVSGLAAGDKVESVKITGIQSVPGSSPNVPSDAVIKNAKGEDVTKNYAIKYVNGTLTMLEVLNKEDHFNYIIGTPEGLSLPTANVTRAEVATIFFRLMTDDARAKFDSLDNNFSDVAKGKWYNRAISTLANAGIIKGDPAGTYRPGDPITRAEMAAIIARFGDFKEGGKTFNDISGHWAQKYIELAASNGWINGNPDGTFKPNNNITRAETVAMINRVLDRQTKDVSDLLPVSQMTNWSDNMDTAKWYYRDMQEATNNHKAERVGNSIYEKWTEKLPDIDWASYQI